MKFTVADLQVQKLCLHVQWLGNLHVHSCTQYTPMPPQHLTITDEH